MTGYPRYHDVRYFPAVMEVLWWEIHERTTERNTPGRLSSDSTWYARENLVTGLLGVCPAELWIQCNTGVWSKDQQCWLCFTGNLHEKAVCRNVFL